MIWIVREFHQAHGLVTQAWSPLGGVCVVSAELLVRRGSHQAIPNRPFCRGFRFAGFAANGQLMPRTSQPRSHGDATRLPHW
jgi:hypothetical protein